MNLDAKANATIITSNEALYHTWYTSLYIWYSKFNEKQHENTKAKEPGFWMQYSFANTANDQCDCITCASDGMKFGPGNA